VEVEVEEEAEGEEDQVQKGKEIQETATTIKNTITRKTISRTMTTKAKTTRHRTKVRVNTTCRLASKPGDIPQVLHRGP